MASEWEGYGEKWVQIEVGVP